MIWAAGGFLLWCCALVLRSRYGSSSWGDPIPLPKVSICFLLLLSGLSALTPVRDHLLERRLEVAAGSVAGFDVVVECKSWGAGALDLGPELGWVALGPDGVMERRTLLDRSVCLSLRDFPSGELGDEHALALNILTHETMHMRGETVEARTECQSMQRNAEMGRALGLDQVRAHELSVRYWRVVHPRLPEEYRSSECYLGGALDEALPDPPWPLLDEADPELS